MGWAFRGSCFVVVHVKRISSNRVSRIKISMFGVDADVRRSRTRVPRVQ